MSGMFETPEMDGEAHKFHDESSDHKYFIVTPRIVKAFCRTPYDLALWDTIRDIAGERGECYLSTSDLATLSGMSTGQVAASRKYWLEIGFLKGAIRRDPGYPQPVWHITVPDLWKKNIEWCEKHPKISDRLAHRKGVHQVNAVLDKVERSPGEQPPSPGEQPPSPGETKKSQKKNQKEGNFNGADAPKVSLEWELVHGKELTEEMVATIRDKQMQDVANLIGTGMGTSAQAGAALAYAFQKARDIVFTESDIKNQRKAARALLEIHATADNVTQAVGQLLAINYKVVDLFSIIRTVKDIINPAPQVGREPKSFNAIRQFLQEEEHAVTD